MYKRQVIRKAAALLEEKQRALKGLRKGAQLANRTAAEEGEEEEANMIEKVAGHQLVGAVAGGQSLAIGKE